MADPQPAAYTIVPWVRRGLASLISAASPANFANLSITLSVNNAPVSGPAVRLIGPGQITSLDPRAIVRTDPRDGAGAFEPNYLAMVELAEPDMPWMFSPTPVANGRVQPWICLVVVPDVEGVMLERRNGGTSVLTIRSPLDPKAELPDLATIDSWAHAQLTGTKLIGGPLTDALNGDPAATVSRLVSARRLEANKSYIGCIVPTYRVGVNAALGLPVDDHDLAPAWDSHTVAPFLLPAYYTFRFHTGEHGDFASLGKKIRPPKEKLNAGTRPMDLSEPGFGVQGVLAAVLGLEGALRSVDNQPTAWPTGAQAKYEEQLRAALIPPQTGDPLVTPPVYGSAQTGASLPSAPVWERELNLDPRTRAAASAGSQVVQRDQEALVASAWDQLGEIRKANQLLRQAQLARQVSTSLNQRHLARVAGDGNWLQITAPLHSRVRVAMVGVTATMRGHVLASRLPSGTMSPAMRKIARPGAVIGRQLPGVRQMVERLNTPAVASAAHALQIAPPALPPKGMVAMDDVSPNFQVKNMTAASLNSAPGWKVIAALHPPVLADAGPHLSPVDPTTTVGPGSSLSPIGPVGPVGPVGPAPPIKPPLVDWSKNPNFPDILKGSRRNVPPPILFPADSAALEVTKTNFRNAAKAVNTSLNTIPATPPDPLPLGGQPALTSVRQQLQTRLNPADTIRARVGARIPLNTGADPLEPVEVGPKFPQAMYAPLAELSPEWMLPGISAVEADCATLLATNSKFIEAYMVGLNEELSRELLWREYPADRQVTFFQNFWGAPAPDIGPIRGFTPNGGLGSHVANPSAGQHFVLLIRATLFQRYPSAMVYAVQAAWDGQVRKLTDTVQYPIFQGRIGSDVNFFGFDIVDPKGSPDPASGKPGWYFVLAEHVTEPRVGLEPEKGTNFTSWNDLSWPDVKLSGNFIDLASAPPKPSGEPVAWSSNAAALAYILMRRPVRVAMHALTLMGEDA